MNNIDKLNNNLSNFVSFTPNSKDYTTSIHEYVAERSSKDLNFSIDMDTSNANNISTIPLFHIPQIPELTKVPPPPPPKKAPISGYDMRTLRKQVDFLHSEIEERTEIQSLLYKQNEELWNYTNLLLEANKNNALIVRDQVHNLHNELQQLHTDRSILAEKLEIARNSKQMLFDITKELKGLEITSNESDLIQKDAEEALESVRLENLQLQESLQDQVDSMRAIHLQLDDHRQRRRDEDMEAVAVEHWHTSKIVMQSAFVRFKKKVQKRIRCSNLCTLLEILYKTHLNSFVWYLWKGFINRKRIMNSAILRRAGETLKMCFDRWKVFFVLEIHFNNAHKKLLLKRIFSSWKIYTKDIRWEIWTVDAIENFQERQQQRIVFAAWKKQTMFLSWKSQRLKVLEIRASIHHLTKLFQAWHYTAKILSLNRTRGPVAIIPVILSRLPLRAWTILCRTIWKRRGGLLRRFFTNSRRMIAEHAARDTVMRHAVMLWAGLKKRAALRRLATVIRQRNRHGRNKGALFRLGIYRHRKLLKHVLLHTFRYGAIMKRQNICKEVATRHYVTIIASWGLRTWRTHITLEKKNRQLNIVQLLRTIFNAWLLFVPMQQREDRIKNSVEIMNNNAYYKLLRSLIKRWFTRSQRLNRLKRSEKYLKYKLKFLMLRKFWSLYRIVWGKTLFWREKELLIEKNRVIALFELKELEISDLEKEREKSSRESQALASTILSLQVELKEKEELLLKQTQALLANRQHKAEIEQHIIPNREKNHMAHEERERLNSVEQIVVAAKTRESNELKNRQNAAENSVKILEEESAILRAEVGHALESSVISERIAQKDLAEQEFFLQQSLEASNSMEDIYRQHQRKAELLESSNKDAEFELQKVKVRIEEVTKKGKSLVAESEASLRLKTSQVGVLRGNTGLSEARVDEIHHLIRDQRKNLSKWQEKQIILDEEKELIEINETRNNLSSNINKSYNPVSSPSIINRNEHAPILSSTNEFSTDIFPPPSSLNKSNHLSRLSNSEDDDFENDEDVMNFLGSAVKENYSNKSSYQLSPIKNNNILYDDEDSSEISSDGENSINKDNDNDSYEAARNSVQQITERLRSRLL